MCLSKYPNTVVFSPYHPPYTSKRTHSNPRVCFYVCVCICVCASLKITITDPTHPKRPLKINKPKRNLQKYSLLPFLTLPLSPSLSLSSPTTSHSSSSSCFPLLCYPFLPSLSSSALPPSIPPPSSWLRSLLIMRKMRCDFHCLCHHHRLNG